MRVLYLLAVFLASPALVQGQARFPTSNWDMPERRCEEKSKPISVSVGDYEVRLVSLPQTKKADHVCRAYLVDRSGTSTLLLEDWDIFVNQATGEDIFGDGHPGLILEGYSGGAHCCYTYKIVDLATPPMILGSIENDVPFFFFKDSTSERFRIMTSDGAFDYFDGMCHACSSFPTVILKVSGGRLVNVSSQFVPEYDTEIAELRRSIDDDELDQFLTVHDLATNGQAKAEFETLRQQVLQIVLAYLYSGREQRAWQTLEEMWPAGDRLRIRKLILSSKAEGILSELSATKAQPTTSISGAR
jgi:hypothetical protein